MKGKKTCETLKAIRQRIADENAIPFVTKPCDFQGECRGTCPACEAEVRYLEKELTARKKRGKSITLAGIAACVMLSATGCSEPPAPTDNHTPTSSPTTEVTTGTTVDEEIVLDGDVPYVVEQYPVDITDDTLEGEPSQDDYVLLDDLAGIVADDFDGLIPRATEQAPS